MQFNKVILLLLLLASSSTSLLSQTEVDKKILLQAFWWDYENNNYQDSWANYLTELAPRLREMGIDAIWIPPAYKNGSTSSTGYSPFDHYDLGDKYQKGWDGNDLNVQTRVGTKDELLRMIAVMHANGIEVISDIAINHVNGAGTGVNNTAGIDAEPTYSLASHGGFKNFRYVCYGTPYVDGTACDYISRKGRWHKNAPNFHPHAGHNNQTGEWEFSPWGPDLAYGYQEDGTGNGYGQSSNICNVLACPDACYSPEQPYNYVRDGARDWIMWFKKQTGTDGFRWDAVKHFPYFVQQDYSYNTKYVLPEWAAGGQRMFNIGEYVGSKNELDAYTDDVTYANGGNEMLLGTFDFGLRAFDNNGGIYSMVTAGGFFDMSSLPAAQQERRIAYYDNGSLIVHRVVSLVNNHDTFRPNLSPTGNYQSWNSESELSPHIDPYSDYLPLAYATILAMDGNIQVFFEDLFDIGQNGNRFSHDPKSSTQLPTRQAIVDLMGYHQKLGFKWGAYKVRSTASGGGVYFEPGSSASDLLVIERSGKAVIGLNDNTSSWQSAWVDTDFPEGTILQDYSGANTDTYTVPADGRIRVNTPPVQTSSGYYGYSIWAPAGALENYTPSRSAETTQEWEMSDDLGDSHCSSLGQGGSLPANDCSYRIAGKIYTDASKPINIDVYKTEANAAITVSLYDLSGNILARNDGTENPVSINYTPTQATWIIIKLRNSDDSQPSQTAYVNASYTAPKVVNVNNTSPSTQVSFWNGKTGSCDWNDCNNWDEGMTPTNTSTVILPECLATTPCIPDDFPLSQIINRSEWSTNVSEFGKKSKITLFPNPSNGEVIIQSEEIFDESLSLVLTDYRGKVLLTVQGNLQEINTAINRVLPSLSSQTYLLKLTHDKNTFVEKLILMK